MEFCFFRLSPNKIVFSGTLRGWIINMQRGKSLRESGGDWIDSLLASREGRYDLVSAQTSALCVCSSDSSLAFVPAGEDAMTGDTDKYLGPQDLKELGDDSLPAEGYMGFSLGARSARYCICCFSCSCVTTGTSSYKPRALLHTALESVLKWSRGSVHPLKHMFIAVLFHILYSCWLLMAMIHKT